MGISNQTNRLRYNSKILGYNSKILGKAHCLWLWTGCRSQHRWNVCLSDQMEHALCHFNCLCQQRMENSSCWRQNYISPSLIWNTHLVEMTSYTTTDTYAKGILCYFKKTTNLDLSYPHGANLQLTGYSDTNWANNIDIQRSVGAYLFKIGHNPIS